MYHQKDSRLWIHRTDEPVADRDAAKDEVDQGKAGAEQCMFLVLNDLGVKHVVLYVRLVLDRSLHLKDRWRHNTVVIYTRKNTH